MSFKQKADLLVAIFPRRATRHPSLPELDINEVRKALDLAEQYRNRVVHSFYAVECDDPSRWVRLKGSLRARDGFSLNSADVNVQIFEECNNALGVIREWSLKTPEELRTASDVLRRYMTNT